MTSLINAIAYAASIFGKKHVKLKLLVIFLLIVKPKIASVVYRQRILVFIPNNTDKYIPFNISLYHNSFSGLKLGSKNLVGHNSLLIATC